MVRTFSPSPRFYSMHNQFAEFSAMGCDHGLNEGLSHFREVRGHHWRLLAITATCQLSDQRLLCL